LCGGRSNFILTLLESGFLGHKGVPMSKTICCSLCGSATNFHAAFRDKDYYRCLNCLSVMMDPAFFLTPAEEKKRYDQHNNDVSDPRYRKFVQPLVDNILDNFNVEAKGLDFGAGPGPVVAVMLREKGYNIALYDPYYWEQPELLNLRYNYLVCSEVIEHFRVPGHEFALLRSLLLPGGSLYCMTELFRDDIDFNNWSYNTDPTHYFFYHHKAIEHIKSKYFKGVHIEGRVVCFDL
jgi:hypothetical protein